MAEDDFEQGLAAFHANRNAEAVSHFQRVIAATPDNPAAHLNLGAALQALERYADALIHFRRAIALNPNLAEPYNNIGNLLVELGRFDDAREAFAIAVSLAPRRGTFHYGLASAKRFTVRDAQMDAMESLLNDQGGDDEERVLLHFALAKAYDECGDPAVSFQHLSMGNALKRSRIVYDEVQALGELNRIAQTFDRAMMDRAASGGHESDRPVFIVGMPRSGTTLVEQILAAHPDVATAGERYDLDRIVSGLEGFPEIAATMSGDAFTAIGATYLHAVEQARRPARRITDKMPWNFRFLGLIARALPNARVIHVMRDPVDTCLSCFSKYFPRDQHYTYDLGELGRYYRAYQTLMDHWREVLPPGVMLDLRYEDLVADFEAQARRLIAHAGLPWSDSCLAFDRANRPVRTASAMQVRQPLYRTAGDRWRPYRRFVGPLLDALK